MKSKLQISLATKEAWKGHIFLIPFYIGVLVFFLMPVIELSFYIKAGATSRQKFTTSVKSTQFFEN